MATYYAALFDFLGIFCHQLPERSWILFGVQAPLCIRCSAILLGALAAAIYVFSRYPLPGARLCALLASPLVGDVALQALGLHHGSNEMRLLTGVGFGFFSLIGSLRWLAERASSKAAPLQLGPTKSDAQSPFQGRGTALIFIGRFSPLHSREPLDHLDLGAAVRGESIHDFVHEVLHEKDASAVGSQ